MDRIKVEPILVNVLNIFKNEIQEKYDFICLQSMHYRNGHLVIYDIATNLKEMWEEHQQLDVSFIECACIQLRIMETLGITFYAISMENIYLLDYEKPIFIIIGDVIKLNNDKFTLLAPSFKHPFEEYLFYPEMMKKKLPLTCHKSAIYYSIGLIVFTFKVGYPEWKNGYYYDGIPITEYIVKIKGKLYYFLKRCFQYELLYL